MNITTFVCCVNMDTILVTRCQLQDELLVYTCLVSMHSLMLNCSVINSFLSDVQIKLPLPYIFQSS